MSFLQKVRVVSKVIQVDFKAKKIEKDMEELAEDVQQVKVQHLEGPAEYQNSHFGVDFEDRLARIRSSLEKIELLQKELARQSAEERKKKHKSETKLKVMK